MLPSRLIRALPVVLALLLALPVTAADQADATGTVSSERLKQRVQFAAAYAAARLGGDDWKLLAKGLEDYPLYPYLAAASMTADIGTVSQARVETYLGKYPGSIPAHDLRRDFLHQLAAREDWDNFRRLYRPGLGYALACGELRARLAAGQKLDFAQDLATIWAKVPLPSACDPVVDWAHKQGMLTQARLWQRVEAASRKGRPGTIDKLSHWMDRGDGIVARRLALVHRNPRKAVHEAVKWRDSTHTRMAVALALQKLAVADDEAAVSAWQKLESRFAFSQDQRHAIISDVALFNATDFESDSLQNLVDLPAAAQTDTTRAWRVRVALSTGDWHKVEAALNALTAEQQRDTAWRYWRARTLAALDRDDAARKIFTQLARQATYYGFLAADWLGESYRICPLPLTLTAAQATELLKVPALDRAFELQALHMLAQARREWNAAMGDLDADQRRAAAVLATRRHWYDRAIFRFSSGKAMHYYAERYPLGMRQTVVTQAANNKLDPAWVYAIIRAESAWVGDARSGADAWGLMQLLPSTGKHVARELGESWKGSHSLLDAATNIRYGSWYLAAMAARFGSSPFLASAAYNAGAGKVEDWLKARRQLPPDVFIDTIPYHETRAYVRRVLAFSVIYDWRLNGNVVPMSDRMPHPGQPYAPPGEDSKRKPVACAGDT